MIRAHRNWDKKRDTNRHADEIQDLTRAIIRCVDLYQSNCRVCAGNQNCQRMLTMVGTFLVWLCVKIPITCVTASWRYQTTPVPGGSDAECTMTKRLLMVLAGMLLACGSHTTQVPSDGMISLPTSEGAKVGTSYDGTLEYSIQVPYPGDASIQQIRSVLRARGWRQREFEFLNGSPFEVTARWRDVDSTEGTLTVWYEQWENAVGDVVSYRYTYRRATGEELPGGPLRVSITHFRKETVQALEQERKGPGRRP
jgi:hypothetical protein